MNAIPWIIFVVSGLVMGQAECRFFDRVARQDSRLRTGEQLADDVYRRPSRLFAEIGREIPLMLRAFLTRQADPTSERSRRIAWAAIIATVAAMAWAISTS